MCDKPSLKELLPAYLEHQLDEQDRKAVGAHLSSCVDCRTELSLLETMSRETVPDPGDAFWAAMPGSVFRAVQEEKSKKKRIDLSRVGELLTLPRWAWASAALGIIMLATWFVINPAHQSKPGQAGDEYAYNGVAAPAQDPAFPNSSVSIAELSVAELENVEHWAAGQLTNLLSDADPVIAAEGDVNEELAELDTSEIERLSTMLQQSGQEG